MIVLNKEALVKQRIENGYTLKAESYAGTRFDNLDSSSPEKLLEVSQSVTAKSGQWEGSEGHAKIWNQIEDLRKKAGTTRVTNSAMLPADWSTLSDLLRLDITRRRMQEADYTAMVMNEQINPAFTKTITLDEFLEWGAIFGDIKGNNDAVPLMEHKSGATGSVTMGMKAVGDKSSLQELIYSPLYDLEKVMRAVTRGFVGLRNDMSILGDMVKYTAGSPTAYAGGWDAGQQQAADTTSGASKEALLYNTLVSAYKKLLLLKDVQTKQVISTPSVYLAIPKGTEFAFNRAINGALNVGGKGKPSNFEALSWIDAIIPYEGDTIYAGEKKVTYSGVASGKAYMFVPRVAYTLTKRGLIMEQGRGSVLNLSQIERVWYFIQTKYTQEFFGYTAGVGSTGYGHAIEISLPTL
jgi:hypothetical protein